MYVCMIMRLCMCVCDCVFVYVCVCVCIVFDLLRLSTPVDSDSVIIW